MAATQAFLVETVLNDGNPRPGVVKVVGHVDGSIQDGRVMKEVADSAVYIKAIFSKDSLDAFQQNFEDSFNSPPDWSQALLLLNQYHVEFQSGQTPDNEEKRGRFVLVIDKFGLYNLHEGFYSKNQPKYIMADKKVQAKVTEIENLQSNKAAQGVDTGSQDSISLSVLLDQMGESSLPETNSASQCDDEPKAEEIHVVCYTRQSALEEVVCLNVEDFTISAEEQAMLDLIPEWREDYVPPATGSPQEHQPSATFSHSLDMELQEPTLRPEAASSPPHRNASQVHGKKTTCASASAHTQEDAGRKTEHVNNKAVKESLSSSVISSHNVEKRDGSSEEDGPAQMEQKDAERTGGRPQNDAEEAECTADSVEGSRTSADSNAFHPDVSFTISSPSFGEESSSGNTVEDQASHHNPSSSTVHDTAAPVSSNPVQQTRTDNTAGALDRSQLGTQSSALLASDGSQVTGQGPPAELAPQPDSTAGRSSSLSEEQGATDKHPLASKETTADLSSKAQETVLENTKDPLVPSQQKILRDGTRERSVPTSSVRHSDRSVVSAEPSRSGKNKQNRSRYASVSPPADPSLLSPDEPYSIGFSIPGSQGFSPTDMAVQDLVPREPDHSQNEDQGLCAPCDDNLQSATQRFTPLDMHTQEMVPEESCSPGVVNCEAVSEDNTRSKSASHATTVHETQITGSPSRNSASKHNQKNGSDRKLTSKRSDNRRLTADCVKKSRTAKSAEKVHPITSTQREASDSFGHEFSIEASIVMSEEEQINRSAQSLSDSPQSQSLLNISPIQPPSSNTDYSVSRSALEADEEERLRLARMASYGGSDSPTRIEAVPVGEKDSSYPATRLSEVSHSPSKTSLEQANTSIVLVDYSGSDDPGDSFDEELVRQADGQRLDKHRQEVDIVSSSETVVIPDSSQEDVITISSSGSSKGETESETPTESVSKTQKGTVSANQTSSQSGRLETVRNLASKFLLTTTTSERNTTGTSISENRTTSHRSPQKQKVVGNVSSNSIKRKYPDENRSVAGTHPDKQRVEVQHECRTTCSRSAISTAASSDSDESEAAEDPPQRTTSARVGKDKSPVGKGSSPHGRHAKRRRVFDRNLDPEDTSSSANSVLSNSDARNQTESACVSHGHSCVQAKQSSVKASSGLTQTSLTAFCKRKDNSLRQNTEARPSSHDKRQTIQQSEWLRASAGSSKTSNREQQPDSPVSMQGTAKRQLLEVHATSSNSPHRPRSEHLSRAHHSRGPEIRVSKDKTQQQSGATRRDVPEKGGGDLLEMVDRISGHTSASTRPKDSNIQKGTIPKNTVNRKGCVSGGLNEDEMPSGNSLCTAQTTTRNKHSCSNADESTRDVQENRDNIINQVPSSVEHNQPSTSTANIAENSSRTHSERSKTSRSVNSGVTSVSQGTEESQSEQETTLERTRRCVSVLFGMPARPEDPRQWRLRSFQLANELFGTVEECLRRPCS